MKKILNLIVGLLSLGAVSTANALLIYETYAGVQLVNEGERYNFEFDMWYENMEGTNSALELTRDAESIPGTEWEAASISITLWSPDAEFERTRWAINAYDLFGDVSDRIYRDNFRWNGGVESDYYWLTATYDFTAEDLDYFQEWGWGNVRISASSTNPRNDNDFFIKRTSMVVDVPEPSTILLTSLGLLGLGFTGRKAKKA
ncbi:MAG: PEP-CTERM sorting domain-containing protein [Candidatus Thiodiazotropha lotti]|nr:PEP-CTERM sorting domain-containing protein [Candidatus Thiodiazotropha lotti]MCG8012782.1 PEP-CTERM sorting domain-containing protein [Candidatus Thiodiazotropha lotti]MCW4212252.1 PEP-CTERM sorting domain-containing protein [Candidatus Thiodiazotropha lotti]MCW4218079.1 PEP-CTERM sorting domain-containing protein [Candidatus Thiodiazotropha lotti]